MKYTPVLDPSYLPMIEWERQYQSAAMAAGQLLDCALVLFRNPQQVARQQVQISLAAQLEEQTLCYLNRFIKSMLWLYGGWRLYSNLPRPLLDKLERTFASEQKFDLEFIVEGIFGRKLEMLYTEQLPPPCVESLQLGGKSGGLRLGFDVGGSDRKIAAIAHDQVLFSTSIIWDPYPQSDLDWHRRELRELFELGASKLPGAVEAIGGSAPGIIMDNEVKAGSLFRGLKTRRDEARGVFQAVAREIFGDIPFRLANDGDVTALAGSMMLEKDNLLGIAMGTSEAAGYTNKGAIHSWFNELAFVPVDMGPKRSQDEWSKDWGTGAEYFSQQAVIRLAPRAGLELPEKLPKPKKLELVQKKLSEAHAGAADIYRSIGCYLGYALP